MLGIKDKSITLKSLVDSEQFNLALIPRLKLRGSPGHTTIEVISALGSFFQDHITSIYQSKITGHMRMSYGIL